MLVTCISLSFIKVKHNITWWVLISFSPIAYSGLNLVGVSQGFIGCIRHVEVNGKVYDITSKSATIEYGANVGECGNDPCKDQPCLNNGTCEAINAETFRCMCIDNFLGESIQPSGGMLAHCNITICRLWQLISGVFFYYYSLFFFHLFCLFPSSIFPYRNGGYFMRLIWNLLLWQELQS